MRVGVLTYHFAYNYGAMLQAYALQTYIQAQGIECEIIDYRPYPIDRGYHFYWRNAVYAPKRFIKQFWSRKRNQFDNFIYEHMNLSAKVTKEEFGELTSYDTILVGSDQVWNLEISHGDMTYFLPNVKAHICRAAYAPSIRNYKVLEPYKTMVGECLKKFRYLSGREQEVVDFLQNVVGISEAQVVVDPVFLLSKEYWSKFSVIPKVPCKRYILLYVLTKDENLLEWCEYIRNKFDLPVITIHPLTNIAEYGDYFYNNIGPQEFLGLIQNAEYVVTNSFHCSSFSIILEKKFLVGKYEQLGERIRNVIRLIGAEKFYFNDSDIFYYKNLNLKALDSWIEDSKSYLNAIILSENFLR